MFDIEKLNWINFQYMKELDADQLLAVCLPHLQKAGYVAENPDAATLIRIKEMVQVLREHIQYGAQAAVAAKIFFTDDYAPENEETAAVLKEETAADVLTVFARELQALDEVTADTVQPLFKKVQKELGVKGRAVYMPIRVAVTGVMHGPDLHHIIALMGREKVMARLQKTGLLRRLPS